MVAERIFLFLTESKEDASQLWLYEVERITQELYNSWLRGNWWKRVKTMQWYFTNSI